MSTLPASAASLALCQQLRALGLNHLHVSVQLKAHSISFDSNKLALSVTSALDKYVASFRLFDSSMCHRCFNNYIQKERRESNKEAHIHFCRRSPCLRLEDSASWSSSGCDLGRQRGKAKRKASLFRNIIVLDMTALELNTLRTGAPAIDSHDNFA